MIFSFDELQINDAIYYESLPVCDYLDEAYPGRKLLPDTPEERVKDKMALTHYDMVIWILILATIRNNNFQMFRHFNEKTRKKILKKSYFQEESLKL